MNVNIGETICQYRQIRKMTQEEFASRLGVTPQAVSKWERGNGLPDLSLIKGICSILKINSNVLLGIDENKVVENNNMQAEQVIKNNLIADPLRIEFGEDIIPCFIEGLKTDYVNQKRTELAMQTGMLLPLLRIRDNSDLDKRIYRILAYGKILYEATINTVNETTYQDIINQTVLTCQEHYATIFNKQLVKIIIDSTKELYPGIADDLVPEKISYLKVERKLQELVSKGESIKDIIHILEELEMELE